jgi:hypothetical protein
LVSGIIGIWNHLRRDDGQYDFSSLGKYDQIIYVSRQADLIIVRNGERAFPDSGETIYQFASAMVESRKKANVGGQGVSAQGLGRALPGHDLLL